MIKLFFKFLISSTVVLSNAQAEVKVLIDVTPNVTVGMETEVNCTIQITGDNEDFIPEVINGGTTFTQFKARMLPGTNPRTYVYTFTIQPKEGEMYCVMKSDADTITSRTVIIVTKVVDSDIIQLEQLPDITHSDQMVTFICRTSEERPNHVQLMMNGNLYNSTNKFLNDKVLSVHFHIKAIPGPVYCLLSYLDVPTSRVSSETSQLTIQGESSSGYKAFHFNHCLIMMLMLQIIRSASRQIL